MLPTHLSPPSCTHARSCNPIDCSPPGSSAHGLFQARILEWVVISFSLTSNFKENIFTFSLKLNDGYDLFQIFYGCSNIFHCSVNKSCLTFYVPCSMPGFPVLHYLPEFAQIHVHWVSDPTIYFSQFYSLFRPQHTFCGILDLWLGIEPVSPAVKMQSAKHWTAIEGPNFSQF